MTGDAFHLGGIIRTFPSDFVVEEVWDNRVCEIGYSLLGRLRDQVMIRTQKRKDYLHFTLVKQNWDNIRALKYICRKIHVSLKRFGFSGMKDKRAITAQRISLWRGKMETMVRLRLPYMFLKDFRYAGKRINLGEATGNRFTITIRDIPKTKSKIVKILNRFEKVVTTRGVPNYYGPQRFAGGNAEVGGAIKDGKLKLGVELILKKVQPYLKEGDIDYIPRVFWYEKKMLRHLEKCPNDYAGALRKIPKRILRMYTHAYQSRVFNEKLEQAIFENQVPKTITAQGFTVPRMPELNTIPIERQSFLTAKNFKVIRVKDHMVTLRFTLSKGQYASTLLSHLS